jgi:hypothetical protein
LKLKLSEVLVAKKGSIVKLYKFNHQNPCNQSKAVSVVFEDKISTCFDYIKVLSTPDVKKVVQLLKSSKTYGGEDVSCFDTDYALIFFDKSNFVYAYVNISFSCNKLISKPAIPERDRLMDHGLRKIGFSENGRHNLLRLLH